MKEEKDIKKLVKELIALQLGVEPDDIDDEDSLVSDLHMRATDISELMESLSGKGFDADNIDLTQIDTVGELIDELRDIRL